LVEVLVLVKAKLVAEGLKVKSLDQELLYKSFEGGQMPLYRRLPKRGFNSISTEKVAILNLEKIQSYIDNKTLDGSELINTETLKKLKLINKNSTKLKILGTGEIKDKVNIEANLALKICC
jgi:large subunit ribosomal protein L15